MPFDLYKIKVSNIKSVEEVESERAGNFFYLMVAEQNTASEEDSHLLDLLTLVTCVFWPEEHQIKGIFNLSCLS
jgi:hypothetical protein